MSKYNQLVIEIYSTGTTPTPVLDTAGDLDRIQGLTFETQYPGGIYGACSFFIPRRPEVPWMIQQGQRIVIRNSMAIVYEGYIIDFQPVRDEVVIGDQVNCLGAWGWIAMHRTLNRRYVDARITDDIWVQNIDVAVAKACEKCDINRETRIRFTPKDDAWATNDFASVYFTSPTGEMIKKVIYDYALAGADFKISWNDSTNGEVNIATVPGSAVNQTYTPATPYVALAFRFTCTSGKTPASDGTYYGQISNVYMYAYTNNAGNYADTLDKIAVDIVSEVTRLNADITRIAASGSPLTLKPFITNGYETIADILTRAADFGDAAGARWACYLDNSEIATTPDGKPVLVVEAQPLLTDYEYVISYDTPNLIAPIQMVYSATDIRNWINVHYIDRDGREQWLTPDDAGMSALTDTSSTALYGRHDYVYDAGESLGGTGGVAYQAGVSILGAYAYPRWDGFNFTVRGFIENKDGSLTPASEIRAGKRVKISSFVDDGSGKWLTFLISTTVYNDETQECSITIGPPPELLLPKFSFPEAPPIDVIRDSGGGGKKKGKKKPPRPKGAGWYWNAKHFKWERMSA